jgi:hypothetical protein
VTHEEDATVRDWTDILARIRFGVVRIDKRNTVAGSAIKAVAGRLADYADSDGSRVRPGLARVALDLELSYETVKRAVSVLVKARLLRLVHAAARRGDANVYRLTIPEDLIDRVDVWSPAKQALEIARINESRKGRRRTTEGSPDSDPQGAQRPADTRQERTPAGRSTPSGHTDSHDPQGAKRPAAACDATEPAGRSALANSEPLGAQRSHRWALSAPPPTNDLTTTETDQQMADLRTDGELSRVSPPDDQDPESRDDSTAKPAPPPGPKRCRPHGLAGGIRPDGKPNCPLCRREAGREPEPDPAPDTLATAA